MNEKTIKKILLLGISVLMVLILTGCGTENGDSSDSFYVDGQFKVPEELKISYEDIVVSIADIETESITDIISLNKNGQFGFTTYKEVMLIPTTAFDITGYKFTPEKINVNSNKTVNFEIIKDTGNEGNGGTELVSLDTSLNSEFDKTNNVENLTFTILKNEENISLENLISDPYFNLNLSKSRLIFQDLNGGEYVTTLDVLADDSNTHEVDLQNNKISLDIQDFTTSILNNSDIEVHFLGRDVEFNTTDISIELIGDELENGNDIGDITIDTIFTNLSNDGLFEFLNQFYTQMGAVELNSEVIGENLINLLNTTPLYQTTNIDVAIDSGATVVSTNTSVIDEMGIIHGTGTTDLSVVITSDSGISYNYTITISVV